MHMYDYHTHTAFSDDSEAPMEEMIESAICRGIKELAITDHHDPGFEDPEFPFQLDFSHYEKALLDAEKRYADKITIIKGLELGIMEGQYEEGRRVAHSFPYDFIIGSFHCLEKRDLYRCDFSRLDVPSSLESYYVDMNQGLKEFKDYDVAGHLTLIDRYIGKAYDYKPYMDILEDTLKTIIYDGKGIEINTSSFKYGSPMWLPREEILKLYRELGGEILTFGSDAHEQQQLANHFEEAYELAKNLGFRYRCTFRQRKPEFHPLP